jgi:chromosome transmission fidelity protein 1
LQSSEHRALTCPQLDDLGQALLNMSALVHGGFVVFLPSYSFLDTAVSRWKATGIWTRLSAKRTIFSEPKTSAETDATLKSYAQAVQVSRFVLHAMFLILRTD